MFATRTQIGKRIAVLLNGSILRVGISAQTVNDHIKNLYRKLEVHSRTHAAVRHLRWIR